MYDYYKGLVIGKAKESKHSKDYNHTLIKVVLYPRNLHLPINTEVFLKQIVKNKKTSDFLELIYPETPSSKLISDGTYLKGNTTTDIESYMKNINNNDLDLIKENLTKASENLYLSLSGLNELILILQDMLNENRVNIKNSTYNINKTTNNISETTNKINNSINQKQLTETINGIENSINNLEQTTQTINNATENISQSIPSINSSIISTQEIVANTNDIIYGVRETLSKPFGGLRLIFGKTIKECSSY